MLQTSDTEDAGQPQNLSADPLSVDGKEGHGIKLGTLLSAWLFLALSEAKSCPGFFLVCCFNAGDRRMSFLLPLLLYMDVFGGLGEA